MAKGDENLKPFDFGSGHPTTSQSAGGGVPGWLKLVLFVVICLGGAATYLYYFDRDLGEKLLQRTPLKSPVTVTTAYKWKDKDGSMQITGHPPKDDTPYEVLKIRSDANVVPSLAPAEEKRN